MDNAAIGGGKEENVEKGREMRKAQARVRRDKKTKEGREGGGRRRVEEKGRRGKEKGRKGRERKTKITEKKGRGGREKKGKRERKKGK